MADPLATRSKSEEAKFRLLVGLLILPLSTTIGTFLLVFGSGKVGTYNPITMVWSLIVLSRYGFLAGMPYALLVNCLILPCARGPTRVGSRLGLGGMVFWLGAVGAISGYVSCRFFSAPHLGIVGAFAGAISGALFAHCTVGPALNLDGQVTMMTGIRP